MAKIRADLQGIVVVGGKQYRAGDTAPANIGSHVLEKEEGSDGSAAKSPTRPKKAEPEKAADAT